VDFVTVTGFRGFRGFREFRFLGRPVYALYCVVKFTRGHK